MLLKLKKYNGINNVAQMIEKKEWKRCLKKRLSDKYNNNNKMNAKIMIQQ